MFDVIVELGGPSLIQDSMLFFLDELEVEVSKLKDKWSGEFKNLLDFYEDNIQTWTVDYVNLNNNISIIVCESHDDLIEIEKEIFEMKIKKEIIVPPLRGLISNWLEK